MFNFSLMHRGSRGSKGERLQEAKSRHRLQFETLEPRTMMAGDVVIDWNNIMLQAFRTAPFTNPLVASRNLAIMSTSVYDAVNSITRTHQPYKVQVNTPATTSIPATVISASHKAITTLYASNATVVANANSAKDAALLAIPNSTAKTQGINLGINVANQILNSRNGDGSATVTPYTPGTDPGDWRPTPPGNAAALLPGWGNVTPWGMASASQFEVNGIPAMTSQAYADALNEVKAIGPATGSTRTADQTAIAKFWNNGAGTATPPGELNKMAQQAAIIQGNSIAQNARMFALLNIGQADAAITCWKVKYDTDFWRPVTAIREAETDGNAATTDDDAWSSLITTPPFPTYSSGHSTFSGSAQAILAAFFGTDNISFTLKSEDITVADRSFTSFSQAAMESRDSRLYGGIHFRFDNEDGYNAGDDLGDYIFGNYLRQTAGVNSSGVLVINGSLLADVITIDIYQGMLRARVGSKTFNFQPSSVTSILVRGNAGNDQITIATNITLDTELHGGLGNDYILGGYGNDKIYGEGGKDNIYGRNGNDWLYGGDDNDFLHGGLGTDMLFGELGNDTLNGGGGTGDQLTQ